MFILLPFIPITSRPNTNEKSVRMQRLAVIIHQQVYTRMRVVRP